MQALCTFRSFVVNYDTHAGAAKKQCRELFDACRHWLFRLRSIELRALFEIESACLLDLVDCAERANLLCKDAAQDLKVFLRTVLSERASWAAAYQSRYLTQAVYAASAGQAPVRTKKRPDGVSLNCDLADLYMRDRKARMRWRQQQLKTNSGPFKRSNVELGDQAPCIKDALSLFEHEYAAHFAAEYKKAEKMVRFAVDSDLIEVVLQDTPPQTTLARGGFSAAHATALEQLVCEPYRAGEATCGLRFNLARGDKNEPWRFYLPEQRCFAQYVKRDGDRLLCQACIAGGEASPCQQAREMGWYSRVVSWCCAFMCMRGGGGGMRLAVALCVAAQTK